MYYKNVSFIILLYASDIVHCFWMSDWMLPVQEEIQVRDNETRRSNNWFPDEDRKVILTAANPERRMGFRVYNEQSTNQLRAKLESILKSGTMLAESLRQQIQLVTKKEKLLKEAIASGKSGVSTVVVSSTGVSLVPSQYIIRDGFWTKCVGKIQHPDSSGSTNMFDEVFASPVCLGNEISSNPDHCVYNSVIKYETLPTRRSTEYVEDEFVCLKPEFNTSLQQYFSVPRLLINETCTNGAIRSLSDHVLECGPRVLSEYTYYPHKTAFTQALPLEYCPDGVCKLFVAWQLFNSTIENVETFKNEKNFKKFFITPGPEQLID